MIESQLKIKESTVVSRVRKHGPGPFEVETDSGHSFPARSVLVAVGRQGEPRRLDCPGADQSGKVSYHLHAAEEYRDVDVLVVGGGNSAIEAALLLMPHNRVTLCYRGEHFFRAKEETGRVDYDAMERNPLFRTYLRQLADAQPQRLTTAADRLALLCNAYNAFVINGVITHEIERSVMDFRESGKGFFDLQEHILSGRTVSLNEIEHEFIRKQFREPRIHVALVCAAVSCPAIRPEAYVGVRLTRQLEDQSVRFANDKRHVAFDQRANVLRLSPILDWYGEDWDAAGGYLPWLADRVEDPALRQTIRNASRGEIDVTFFRYDWSLNGSDRPPSEAETPKASSFGSGTVPNG